MDLDRLIAFLKSVFYIGILGNGITQWYYWKILVKAMIFSRKSLTAAMTLMVYEVHFRKMAKLTSFRVPIGHQG